MAGLIDLKDRFDIAFGNDPDTDRHGIVTPTAGLLSPNHYLSVAVYYLFQNRPQWGADVAVGKTLVSSSMIDRVAAQLGRGIPDVVLLAGRSGHLFREVFTYDGAGLLFTATRASRIRRGEMRDVTDIGLLNVKRNLLVFDTLCDGFHRSESYESNRYQRHKECVQPLFHC